MNSFINSFNILLFGQKAIIVLNFSCILLMKSSKKWIHLMHSIRFIHNSRNKFRREGELNTINEREGGVYSDIDAEKEWFFSWHHKVIDSINVTNRLKKMCAGNCYINSLFINYFFERNLLNFCDRWLQGFTKLYYSRWRFP